jgi:uncharacterized membrane protein YjfL (UPF0719 family)
VVIEDAPGNCVWMIILCWTENEMIEITNRGNAAATASLTIALVALLAPAIQSPLLMAIMVHTNRPLPGGDVLLSVLFVLPPVCGVVAAICGHIARRRIDINQFPQKSAMALAGLIIGYAVIVQSLSSQIVARLGSLALKGM